MATPKYKISSEEAVDLFIYNQIVKDSFISGTIEIQRDSFTHRIRIENCIIQHFKSEFVGYQKPIKFVDCEFKNCEFPFCRFIGGLDIINCTFNNYLDFQSGGHNQNNYPINIENSTFKNFVNFFDCDYEGPVIIKNNNFQKGTNIFGNKNKPFEARFKFEPIVESNKGLMNIDDAA
jgi:hypothetical protein